MLIELFKTFKNIAYKFKKTCRVRKCYWF